MKHRLLTMFGSPSIKNIEARIANFGGTIFSGSYNVNIFGIRNLLERDSGGFNDLLGVIYDDKQGIRRLFAFPATVDPGIHYRKNFFPGATATGFLKAGNYKGAYAIGSYYGDALLQVKPVTLHRDSDKDEQLEVTGDEQTGLFGVHIHRRFDDEEVLEVGMNSAACQVPASNIDFAYFMTLIKTSALYYGNTFSYTLCEWPTKGEVYIDSEGNFRRG